MNKTVSTIAIIMASLIIALSLFVVFMQVVFAVPEQMKDKSVCFLAPELTWSDKIADLTNSFGAPSKKAVYDDITGTKTHCYKTEYKNHKMDVSVETKVFPYPTNAFNYGFFIQCENREDAQDVFDECYRQILKDNKGDEYFDYTVSKENSEVGKENIDNGVEASFSIDYGAVGIYYELYQNDNFEVVLLANCMY